MHRPVSLTLDGDWRLAFCEDGPEALALGPASGGPWIPTQVPEPVHLALQRAGLLPDLELGLNSLGARWVEDAFWVYRREFDVPSGTDLAGWRLVLELVECFGRVFLNGSEIGTVCNAHRPHRLPCGPHLRPGRNEIAVVVDSGARSVIDRPVQGWLPDRISVGTRRNWLRKPQYQCGWDWNPRLVNVGLLGSVRLERGPLFLDGVGVTHRLSDDLSEAEVGLLLEVDSELAEGQLARVEWEMPELHLEGRAEFVLSRGRSLHRCSWSVPRPPLWSPAGVGAQALCTLRWRLEAAGSEREGSLRTGFRRVEIDQPEDPNGGSRFVLRVNGRPVFCKGANLVPADLLYSTTPAERWVALARMAREANMNLLRVWGGGSYLPEAMADACDELGLLVWHDFAYACAKTDASDPFLRKEAEEEARHQTLRLSAHPSLAVWCGNNEVLQADAEWPQMQGEPKAPHLPIFFELLPAAVAERAPHVPYWPGSPWSPDGSLPNDPRVGDQHPWEVSLAGRFADWWQYRRRNDRFPNEGGVLGCSVPKTLREFLPADQRRVHSPAWRHHDNFFAWLPGAEGAQGRAYETFREWTGLNPEDVPLEDFALLSGVLQAEGLDEYIRNYRRRMFDSASAVFWMFNDSWPVAMGWTTQDHRLRRKPAYHAVRRAFSPVAVVVAEEGDGVLVFGVNDTDQTVEGTLQAGVFLFEGRPFEAEPRPVALAPNSSTVLLESSDREWREAGFERAGFAALLTLGDGTVLRHRLLKARFRDLTLPEARVRLRKDGAAVTLESETWAWGVLLDRDGESPVPDNAFDLLPGVPHRLTWEPGLGEPSVAWVASEALRRLSGGGG
ncbi:MAG: glycoside hydrolase family 2 protein [Fimbriimonadaceae bacterium]